MYTLTRAYTLSSKLVVDKTIGAGLPVTEGKIPVLTMDVWEHA
jgi:superoxide dismutase